MGREIFMKLWLRVMFYWDYDAVSPAYV